MRQLRLIVPFVALLLVAAACANDDDGGGGGGDGATPATEENTGNVNVLNALSAEEGEALQTLVDEQINPEVESVAGQPVATSLSKPTHHGALPSATI